MTARQARVVTDVPDHPTMLAAIRLACRAPSVHNTQPWRWVLDGSQLHLYRDVERQLPSADPIGRQATISCGAVLHHARTVFAAHHWHTDTVRLPNPGQPDHLATIDFRPWPDPPAGVFTRARAIDRRYSDRLPMRAPTNWDRVEHTLRMLVSPHDIELVTLDESARRRLTSASEQSTALRRYDMQYQTELRWWAGHSDLPEGVPPSALVSASEFDRVGIGRDFPAAPQAPRRGALEDHARLVVLGSAGESAMDWLQTGEALSAVLLECTAAGLATCALTHITEHPAGLRLMASLAARLRVPQVLLRIGTAPEGAEPPPTPRRPLVDVFTEQRRSD